MSEFFCIFSFIIILYTYIGYPVLIYVFSSFFRKRILKKEVSCSVSAVIAAYNEEKHLERKIQEILKSDYSGKIEILAGSDGSDDSTNDILHKYEKSGLIKTVISAERGGKPKLLNKLMKLAQGEIIIFFDARQKIDRNTVREITANFSDPHVGCVSGELLFVNEENNAVTKNIGLYWKYEKWLRNSESAYDSMIGATGALYAIRRELFSEIPEDIILDDVYQPLQTVLKGYRAVFDNSAFIYDKAADESRNEFRRKTRTLAGNFQLFFRYPYLFNPFKNRIAFQFFSHKFLRAVNFLFLFLLFITCFFLIEIKLYLVFFILQAVFYLLGITGFLLEKIKIRSVLFNFPYVFILLNAAALNGLTGYLLQKETVKWNKT